MRREFTQSWDASNIFSGIYFARMEAAPLSGGEKSAAMEKMLLAK